MAADRHSGAAPFLEPDAKSQVTLRYDDGKPVAATAIVVSTQHAKGYDQGDKEAELHAYVKKVVADVLPAELLSDDTVYHINPTGSFEIGGPDGDAGLTGRKIIVDTYGGAAPHGGGAFSRQGPDQGRPLGRLCRALPRQEHRRRRPRAGAARSSSPMRSACPSRCRSTSTPTAPASSTTPSSKQAIGRIAKLGGLTPRGIRTHPRPQQADLRSDRRLRPFRPQARGRSVPVGAARPGRGFEGRGRAGGVAGRGLGQPRRSSTRRALDMTTACAAMPDEPSDCSPRLREAAAPAISALGR